VVSPSRKESSRLTPNASVPAKRTKAESQARLYGSYDHQRHRAVPSPEPPGILLTSTTDA
jgi:hypothetical protein